MKKITLIILCMISIAGINTAYSSAIIHPKGEPTGFENLKTLRADKLILFSQKQFSELTGKKLNIFEKLSFKLLKLKMKHDLKKDPNLTLQDYYGKAPKKRLGTGWIILITVTSVLLILFLVAISITTGWKSQTR